MARRTRVAITGIGVRTPMGDHPKELWNALTAGRSAVSRITRFGTDGLPADFACQVPPFDTATYMTAKEASRMDPATVLACCAASDALADAGGPAAPPERRAVVIGTAIGSNRTIESTLLDNGGTDRGRPYPMHVPKGMHNAAAATISMRHEILGPSLTVSTACASGGHAIGEGLRLLRDGSADLVLAGGADACVSPTKILALARAGALSRRVGDPAGASRPFDSGRDGFVLAEGAACLVLEPLDRARDRGARVYAEIAGYGRTSDAYHLTMPDPDGAGAYRCMRQALDDAGLTPGEVAHVNAHATGTPHGDLAEARAIARLFGPGGVPVTAPKSMLGHGLGASGAVEAVIAVLSLLHRTVPPSINLDDPDPACEIDAVVRPRPAAPGPVLSNSFGFGGHNASLVLAPAAT